ncbi:putative DsbA family dithiol-disulfide isomerase [Pedobacter sp. CG_S7]|uniref:DsbA family oxidoreductase n=1 Tax=Pedobacter sp. CG_S7 TaxID=3143930 RepID=UPI003394639D
MKIAIWSDIRCPFCYIGKRKFEHALAQFKHKDNVEVEWHSFELDPQAKTQPEKNAYDYLAEVKGQSKEWSMEMHQYIKDTAAENGLVFNFDELKIANSFNAHRLIQLAKSLGLADDAEERLFAAHFTDGKNIANLDTLIQIGIELGIEKAIVTQMLTIDSFSDEVRYDEKTAQSIGISGVPFFIINQKHTISGAQSADIFLKALNQGWLEGEPQR